MFKGHLFCISNFAFNFLIWHKTEERNIVLICEKQKTKSNEMHVILYSNKDLANYHRSKRVLSDCGSYMSKLFSDSPLHKGSRRT